jgi:hypothetical protein
MVVSDPSIVLLIHSVPIGELRKAIKRIRLPQPKQWFEHTMAQGVVWLNTALTFTGKEQV